MRVLVVDDDEAISEFISWVLIEEGHEVCAASNGALALEEVKRLRPDVILLDMQMPVMNGWQFAQVYRARCQHPAPVIVVTAAQDAASRAMEVHADGYLGKPFDIDDLIATVQRIGTSA